MFTLFFCILPDGELYSATVSDFSASDPLIYKEPLRTGQADSKHLNCESGEIPGKEEGSLLSPELCKKCFRLRVIIALRHSVSFHGRRRKHPTNIGIKIATPTATPLGVISDGVEIWSD